MGRGAGGEGAGGALEANLGPTAVEVRRTKEKQQILIELRANKAPLWALSRMSPPLLRLRRRSPAHNFTLSFSPAAFGLRTNLSERRFVFVLHLRGRRTGGAGWLFVS